MYKVVVKNVENDYKYVRHTNGKDLHDPDAYLFLWQYPNEYSLEEAEWIVANYRNKKWAMGDDDLIFRNGNPCRLDIQIERIKEKPVRPVQFSRGQYYVFDTNYFEYVRSPHKQELKTCVTEHFAYNFNHESAQKFIDGHKNYDDPRDTRAWIIVKKSEPGTITKTMISDLRKTVDNILARNA